MSLLSLIKGRTGATGFGFASTAEEVTANVDLTGKQVLVTGVNSGIGKESARVFAKRGAHVLGLARTKEKAEKAGASFGGDFSGFACDLSEPSSVHACVAEVQKLGTLDVMLCNAGIMALPRLKQKHGYELQFLTNHIGHFLLVTGLLDKLEDDGRVVMLSSAAHTASYAEGIQFDNLSGDSGYGPWRAYGQSKLANLLFARKLARRLEATEKTSNAVHPGVIRTNLSRHMNPLLNALFPLAGLIGNKTVQQGAATQCFVAANPKAEGISGEYFADCNVTRSSRHGRDQAMADRLWEVSEKIVSEIA